MSVTAAALAMGVLGSSHCLAMCGGIAGALTPLHGRRGGDSAAARTVAVHLGRATSYSLAGAIVGGSGALFAGAAGSDGMLILRGIAALLVIAAGLRVAGLSDGLAAFEKLGGLLWRRIAPLARVLRSGDSIAASFGAGMAWGWLPCGLVYSALALAAAAGSAPGGAIVMAAFAAGTMPATLGIFALASRGLAGLRSLALRRAAGTLVVGLGLWSAASAVTTWSEPYAPDVPACHELLSREAVR